jgi:hypothetical protein
MSQPIRAVYKSGQFWLLDPVYVTEGQKKAFVDSLRCQRLSLKSIVKGHDLALA